MPLLYGEGAKAFLRLQMEILKTTGDQSLFAWNFAAWRIGGHNTPLDLSRSSTMVGKAGMLAREPAQFQGCSSITFHHQDTDLSEIREFNGHLRLSMAVVNLGDLEHYISRLYTHPYLQIGILPCGYTHSAEYFIGK